MASNEQNKESIAKLLGEVVIDSCIENGALLVYVAPENIRRALEPLRDADALQFDILSYITAVDYHPRTPRFEVVYDLYSLRQHHRVRVKCKLEDTGSEEELPEMDSVADLYLTANWHERECYDLFGIRFAGHPDLRRILLPDRWDGHPLRKEEPFDGKRVWKVGSTVVDSVQADSNLGL